MFISFRSRIIATLIATVIVFGGGGAVAASWMNQNDENKIISEMQSSNKACNAVFNAFANRKEEVKNLNLDFSNFSKEAEAVSALATPKANCASNLTGKMYVNAMKSQQKELEAQGEQLTAAINNYMEAKSAAARQKVTEEPTTTTSTKKKNTTKKKATPQPKKTTPKKTTPKKTTPKQPAPAPQPNPQPNPQPAPAPQPTPQPAPSAPAPQG